LLSIIFDMSRWVVNQRPFSRKKRKQSLKKILNRSGISVPEIKISKTLRNIISWWLLFIVLIVWWVLILIKLLFFQPEQTIAKVKFSEDTLATYQDIELFNLISDQVKWKNYYILSSHKDELLTKVQQKFPFVWAIELQLEPKQEIIVQPNQIVIGIQLPLELPIRAIQKTETYFPLKDWIAEEEIWWTLWVQLMYYDPKILVKLNDKEFAVWDENTFVELKDWMLLWIRDPEQEPLFVIETPIYLSWTTSLNWFFFEMKLNEFLEISTLAKAEFWDFMKRFVYLAWSRRIAIFTTDDKTLYFNFPEWWEIAQQRIMQINKYNILKEKYPKFWNVWTIDLWALEENKTIIKWY